MKPTDCSRSFVRRDEVVRMREGRRKIKVRTDGIRERTTIQTARGCHPRGAAGDWHVDVKLKNYGMTCPFRFRTVTVTVLVDNRCMCHSNLDRAHA